MTKKETARVAQCITDLTREMTLLREAIDSEPNQFKANAMSHDVSQLWVIIQSLMAL